MKITKSEEPKKKKKKKHWKKEGVLQWMNGEINSGIFI